MLPSIRQMVASVTPSRDSWNWGGSTLGSSMPGGRGRLVNSSMVASTIPAPRSFPLITFLPTFTRSGSCPVLTGQRSTPGLSSGGANGAAIGAAWAGPGPGASPAAALICAATCALTTGSVLTSVIGAPSAGGGPGGGVGGMGGVGGGVGGGGGTGGAGRTPGVTSPDRPKTTKRGVASRFDPSPSPLIVYPVAAKSF